MGKSKIEKLLKEQAERKFYRNIDWRRTQSDKDAMRQTALEESIRDEKIRRGCGYILLAILTSSALIYGINRFLKRDEIPSKPKHSYRLEQKNTFDNYNKFFYNPEIQKPIVRR